MSKNKYSPINLNESTLSMIKEIMDKEGFATMAQAARHAITLFYEREYVSKPSLIEKEDIVIKETEDTKSLFSIRNYLDHDIFKYLYQEFKTYKFEYNSNGTSTTIEKLRELSFFDCNAYLISSGNKSTEVLLTIVDKNNQICHLFDGAFSFSGGTGGSGLQECLMILLKKEIDFIFISTTNSIEDYTWALYHYKQTLKSISLQKGLFSENDFRDLAYQIMNNRIFLDTLANSLVLDFVKDPDKNEKETKAFIKKIQKKINKPLKTAKALETGFNEIYRQFSKK